ncbi:hypothetical protein V6N13_097741 [Hibiscus sabdariffa]|uniref:RNase H type-1 domain-containing protein n=2 Tax=Hibiscus sabdariffa TaxID=183260 RepID=A0ABR1ZFY4_9ROSI
MHKFLPAFANLQQRKLIVRNTCRLCEASTDSIAHLVFLCLVTMCILASVGLPSVPALQRNAIVHEGFACSSAKVSTFVLSFLLELESLANVPAPTMRVKDVKWFHPNGDVIKFNFDASFHTDSKSSISGVIARDSQGLIVAACSYPHLGVVDVFITEALAFKMVVSFTFDLGFRLVQFEGDSLSVIKKLNSAMPDKSIISPIIRDIKEASK